MNEDADNDKAQELAGLGDLAGFFAPSWTKGDDDGQVRIVRESYGSRRDDDLRPRRDGDRRDGERRPRRDGERRDGERRDGERRPRHDGERRDGERRDGERRDGERREFRRDRAAPHREPVREKPLSLDVRFLPNAQALDAVIHRVQASRKAYPFRDIVRLFQKDDASLAVRIEADRQADPSARLWQCAKCSLPALSEDELVEHLMANHLGDFFEAREIEVEAPSGNFPCVARCGLTGELLGPPNHHSYAEKIRQMIRDHFPNMTESEYRSRVEMVKDPEAIEQWRESARKQIVYFRKAEERGGTAAPPEDKEAEKKADSEAAPAPAEPAQLDECGPSGRTPSAPPAPPAPSAPPAPAQEERGVSRQEAEAIFRKEIMPGLVGSATHIVCQATALKNMPNRRLAAYLSGEFARDEALRSQGTLARAIHAAFHHRGLRFFRANDDRGQEFTTAVAPLKFDTENVTAEIRAIVDFVAQNPCCTQKALIEAVAAGASEETARRVAASLRWLVEKGHVVEFFNGMLSPGASHPAFAKTRGGTAAPPEDKEAEKKADSEAEAPAETQGGTAAPPEDKEGGKKADSEAAPPAETRGGTAAPPEDKEGGKKADSEAAPAHAEPAQLDECGPSGRTPSAPAQEGAGDASGSQT